MAKSSKELAREALGTMPGLADLVCECIEVGMSSERERVAKFIEDMDDGPLTTKAVKSYIAAAVRSS